MRGDRLASEEGLLDLLGTAFSEPQRATSISPSTSRLLTRAKAYLAAHLAAPVRLADVARAAGTSPAYLTTVFRRSEGRPLHQYLVQLRLARALVELPHAPDLTTLACELGFSTHSHFTSAFRRAFGCTPSQYRASAPIGLRARRARGPLA
jgi:AraC-like DNA-binding protein